MSLGRECKRRYLCVSYDYTWQLVGRQVSGGGKDKQIGKKWWQGKSRQDGMFLCVRSRTRVRASARGHRYFFFGGSGDS